MCSQTYCAIIKCICNSLWSGIPLMMNLSTQEPFIMEGNHSTSLLQCANCNSSYIVFFCHQQQLAQLCIEKHFPSMKVWSVSSFSFGQQMNQGPQHSMSFQRLQQTRSSDFIPDGSCCLSCQNSH